MAVKSRKIVEQYRMLIRVFSAARQADTGTASVFLLNALSFVGVIGVLYRWRSDALFKSALPAERLFGSMRSGLRYIRHAPALRATLLRAFVFTLFVSAAWALLAVVARRDLRQGAIGYGILNGSMGLGAVIGAVTLAHLRRVISADRILMASSGVFVATLAILAFVHIPAVVILFLIAGGFAWTSTMATLNVSVQLSAPQWVRARALGAYQMIMQGGMAMGGLIWGTVAESFSTPVALACAGAGLLITLPLTLKLHVLRGELPDLTPYKIKRPVQQFAIEPQPTDGPFRVSIEYLIRPEDYNAFTRAVHQLGDVRLRDGAMRWGVFQDVTKPERLNETFIVESWMEYLRQRERFTASDWQIRDRVLSFHKGDEPPKISHMIYAKQVADEV